MPYGQRDYFERLQSFRGVGALMVAFYHCQGVAGGELPLHPVPERGQGTAQIVAHHVALAVFNGHGALMAFFVLSGFVLALSLRRGPHLALPASLAFVSARLFRIVPANAIAVLVAVAIAAVAGAAPQAQMPPPWAWSQIAANMTLVETTINPIAWSLAVELLAAPFIVGMFVITRRRGSTPLMLATAAAVVLSFAPSWIGYRPLGRNLFAFFAGMLMVDLGPRLCAALTRRQAAACFAAALSLWFGAGPLLGRWSHWTSLVEAAAAASLIALLTAGPQLAAYRVFELRPFLWLGEISYSLYLYHYILFVWLAPPADAAVFVRLGGWGQLVALFVAWIATVAAAIPVGWLSYAMVERPGIGVGRVLTRRLRTAAAPLALQRAPVEG